MAKIKSAWWRQQPLSALTTLTIEQVNEQATEYRAWLAKARGWSKEATADYIDTTRTYDFAPATSCGGTLARSDYFGDVEVRAIKPRRAGRHYGYGGYLDTLGWHRQPSNDAVPVYAVIYNGEWLDSFLAKSRAVACAKAMAAAVATADRLAA